MKIEEQDQHLEDQHLEDQHLEDQHMEDQEDSVSDKLTSKDLEKYIKTLVDEKIQLSETATDNDEPIMENEEEESKGLGLFPIFIISSVVIVGFTAVMMRNRPNIVHGDVVEENHA